LGLLLLTAAILKGYELATGPVAEKDLLTSRWFLILAVEFELVLGLSLISGLWKRTTWWVALACFVGFACISSYKVLLGEANCGCFGRILIDPRLALAIDLFAIAGLVCCAPKAAALSTAQPIRKVCTVGALAVVLGGTLAYAAIRFEIYSQQDDAGILNVRNNSTLVLMPEKWQGKLLPVQPYVTIDTTLQTGRWVVVIYDAECSVCQQALPLYLKLAREKAPALFGRQVAFLALPPYGAPPQDTHLDNIACGVLADTKEWITETPILVTLENGFVTGEVTGEKALDLAWLREVNEKEQDRDRSGVHFVGKL
jgi:hypothetical protein